MVRFSIHVFFTIFCIGITSYAWGQTRTLDSLRNLLATQKLSDTAHINATLEYAYEIRYLKADSSILLVREALGKARQKNFPKGIAQGIYLEGIWYSLKGKYIEALENYFQSLEMYEKMKSDKGIARVLNNIAIVYYYQRNYAKAEVFLKKCLAINEKIQNIPEIARSLNNLGRNCLEQNRPKEALQYFRKSLAIIDKYKISTDVAVYYCNVAEALYKLNTFEEALQNAEKSLVIAIKLGNKRVEARANIVQGAIYLELGDIDKAKGFLEQGTPIASNLKFPEEHLLALEYSYKLYERIKDYPKAYSFFKEYKVLSDTITSQTNYKNTLQREHEYNEQRRKIERQTEIWIRYSLIAGVLLALGLVFFALRAFKIKAKAFTIISQQQEELLQNQEEIIAQRNFIEQQNKNLTHQNEQITHSIRTALAIQQALLPFESRVRAFLKDYFVLYEPRDIVSGDFYWIEKIDHKAVIIVGDCTGHGVPGAFMSLIAINLIERIVLQQEITAPAKILAELHSLVRIALKQDDIENQTGMDVAITVLDLPTDTESRQETTLHFAGAKRHLYYIDAQNPTEVGKVAGSRKAIGGLQNEKLEFAEHTLVLPAESIFYMTSDGLPDQNNQQRKRLGETPIFETLLRHYPVLPAQHKGLKMLLESYMQNTYQRDDILLLGVKV